MSINQYSSIDNILFLTDLTNWHNHNQQFRSTRPEMFCKKGVLRNFANFTRKHLSQSLFLNKVAGISPAQVFSCEFCKFLRTPFLTEHPRWLLLIVAVSASVSIDTIFPSWYFSFFSQPFFTNIEKEPRVKNVIWWK